MGEWIIVIDLNPQIFGIHNAGQSGPRHAAVLTVRADSIRFILVYPW